MKRHYTWFWIVVSLSVLSATVLIFRKCAHPETEASLSNPMIAKGACASMHMEANGKFETQMALWNQFLTRDLDRQRSMAPQLTAFKEAHGYPLHFWSEGSARPPDRLESDHPCGTTMQVFAKKLLPGIENSRLNKSESSPLPAETVAELEGGSVVQMWSMPVDHVPHYIEGDTLIVDDQAEPLCTECRDTLCQPVEVALAIKPDGNFDIRDKFQTGLQAQSQTVKCPDQPDFPSSDYSICLKMKDIRTKKERVIMFESPCT